MVNELNNETSPYLLQHANNPVHWRGWSAETLALAKSENKPILLSIGYAACHWCHVMAHESFENEAIAEVMNSLYINIKVDREERPDLDAIYQAALALIGEHGGWPLTMFLTPEGEPFWGGTYFPPEAKYGRPGFGAMLIRVNDLYKNKGNEIAQNVATLKDALAKRSEPVKGDLIGPEITERLSEHLLKEFDPVNGGIGTAPKFPNAPALELVFGAGRRSKNSEMTDAVLFALGKMCQGGIYDHVGGGISRYATDDAWLVPHFEKMLYDNAQLLELLRLVHSLDSNPLYSERMAETADWVIREMVTEGGGFAGTLDADSEGVEGKFYVWDTSELDDVLGDDSEYFKETYDASIAGNWEGKNILNRTSSPDPLDNNEENRLLACRIKLLAARSKRVRPGLDDKILADWNGLMIAALARAGGAMDRPDWIMAASGAYDFIVSNMVINARDENRLVHSFCAGQQGNDAMLDDYAAMARAALILYGIDGNQSRLDQAIAWTEILDVHYRDENGGYYFSADDADDLILRTRNANDSATPSGAGIMVDVFARLWLMTGIDLYRKRAEEIVAAFSATLESNAFSLATLINAAGLLHHGVETIIIGKSQDPETRALISAALSAPEPNLVLQVIDPGATLAPGHPALGKTQLDGKPTAYVCRNQTCSEPITEAKVLSHGLCT
jgi:uncharacterized protein YyaL (SSP411 family)